jgi:Zn-dependent protease
MEIKEITDIIISWIVLSIAFMFLFTGISFWDFSAASKITIELFAVYLFIVAVSFLSHELGHRQVARRYGFKANFEMWSLGLALAFATSLAGFLFAAPGAVMIRSGKIISHGKAKLNEMGLKISIAGIAINLAMGFLFLIIRIILGPYLVGGLDVLYLASKINFVLAFFNLLPIPPLDGSKVFYYNRTVWIASFAVALIFYIVL